MKGESTLSCEYGANLILLGVALVAAPAILTAAAVVTVGAGTVVAVNAAAHAAADAIKRHTQQKAVEERRQALDARKAAESFDRNAAESQRKMTDDEQAQRAALLLTANTLETLSKHRNTLAEIFEQQTDALTKAVSQQAQDAISFQASVAAQQASGEADMQRLLNKASQMNTAASTNLDAAVNQLHADIEADIRNGTENIVRALADRDAELDTRLAAINDLLERRRVGGVYARTLLQQVQPLVEQLQKDYMASEARVRGCVSLAGIQALQKDSVALLEEKQPEAALTAITSLMHQVAEISLRMDQVRYEFVLADQQLDAEIAVLRELVADVPLELPQEYTDGRRSLPRNTAYWCSADWGVCQREAQALLEEAGKRNNLTLTSLHELNKNICSCAASLRALRTDGQARLLCCAASWDVMRNAVRAFQTTGWEWKGFGYEKLDERGQWDYRSPMVARFSKVGGARADLKLTPGCENGQWGVQIHIDRSDSGVVDEGLRAAQRKDLERELNSCLNGQVQLHCVRGKKKKNSLAAQNENRLPRRWLQETN